MLLGLQRLDPVTGCCVSLGRQEAALNLSFLLRNLGITVWTWWVPSAWSQWPEHLAQLGSRVRGG